MDINPFGRKKRKAAEKAQEEFERALLKALDTLEALISSPDSLRAIEAREQGAIQKALSVMESQADSRGVLVTRYIRDGIHPDFKVALDPRVPYGKVGYLDPYDGKTIFDRDTHEILSR